MKIKNKKNLIIIVLSLLLITGALYLTLTKINKVEEIRIVGTETPPFEYYNNQGEIIGVDIDFIEKIFSKLKIDYTIELMDWDDAITEIKEGRADMILEAGYTKEREEFISYRDEHIEYDKMGNLPKDALWIAADTLFFRAGEEYNLTLEEMEKNQYKIGVVKEYAYFEEFWDFNLDIIEYNNPAELIVALNQYEVDIIVLDLVEFFSVYKQANTMNAMDRSSESLSINANYLLFSKKYDSGKYAKIKEAFYEELIRLKEEESLHQSSYQEHFGMTFTEAFRL